MLFRSARWCCTWVAEIMPCMKCQRASPCQDSSRPSGKKAASVGSLSRPPKGVELIPQGLRPASLRVAPQGFAPPHFVWLPRASPSTQGLTQLQVVQGVRAWSPYSKSSLLEVAAGRPQAGRGYSAGKACPWGRADWPGRRSRTRWSRLSWFPGLPLTSQY